MLDPDVTNTAQAEMVGRLLVMYSHRGDGIPTQYVNPNGPEAAAEIERTAGEVAALRALLVRAQEIISPVYVHWHGIARQALATSLVQGQGIDPAPVID